MKRWALPLAMVIAAMMAQLRGVTTANAAGADANPDGLSDWDIRSLANMLRIEGIPTNDEGAAGAVWAALNRAQRSGRSVSDVLRSVGPWAEWGASCGRNERCEYNRLLDQYDPPQSTIDAVIAAVSSPSPIGRREHFVHPSYGPYGRASGARTIPTYDYGRARYLPTWSTARDVGGAAPHEPMTLGVVGGLGTRFT